MKTKHAEYNSIISTVLSFVSRPWDQRWLLSQASACCLALAASIVDSRGGGPFLPTGTMIQGRTYHTATLMKNGKVLVAGGYDQTASEIGENLKSSELYNPATGLWTSTGDLGVVRSLHSATLLDDGRVLATGGSQGPGLTISSAQIYNPATAMWSHTTPMTYRRKSHASVLLANGKVLVFGGSDDTSILDSAEVYDPSSGTWSDTGRLNARRSGAGVCMLADGRILVSGGTDELNRRLKSVEIYNPSTGVWSPGPNMTGARSYHTQTTLQDGRILVTGGNDLKGHLSSCEIFDPATGSWKKTASMIAPRFWHQATLLNSGNVLITGNHYVADILSPKKGICWPTWDGVADYRFNHTATLLDDGRVLIAGGSQGLDEGLVKRAEIYDPGLDSARPEIEVLDPKKRKLVSGGGSVSMGSVKSRATGTPQVFRIKNLGNLPLKSLKITLRGVDRNSFILGDFPKTTIDTYEAAVLKVKFRPIHKGNLKAELRIKSNDANENPFIVRLTGVGL